MPTVRCDAPAEKRALIRSRSRSLSSSRLTRALAVACGGLFDAPASPTASSSASAASSTGPSLSSSHAPASLLFSLLAHQAAAELGLRLRVGIHCGPVTSGLVGSVRGARASTPVPLF